MQESFEPDCGRQGIASVEQFAGHWGPFKDSILGGTWQSVGTVG